MLMTGRRRVVKKCIVCGKEFASFRSGKRKFCSKKCWYTNEKNKDIRIEGIKNNWIYKKCIICGEDFFTNVQITKTCSDYCANKRKEDMKKIRYYKNKR